MDLKYQLSTINIEAIPNNKNLGVSIQEQDIDRCIRTMRNYGLLTPIVIGKIADKNQIVLSGQCEINALRQMKIKESEAIMVDCKNESDANKVSLLISSLRQQPSAVAEGLLIRNLVSSENIKQKDIAHLIGKSESWITKRLALVQKLSKPVIDMVINKHLCSRTAEEVAKLPEEVQVNFAQKAISFNLPKSKVEHLVMMYNNPSISENIKNIILENPQNAANILKNDIKKHPSKILPDSDARKMALIKTSISIIIRAIATIESNIHQVSLRKICEQKSLFTSCITLSERFNKLLLEYTKKTFPGESSVEKM